MPHSGSRPPAARAAAATLALALALAGCSSGKKDAHPKPPPPPSEQPRTESTAAPGAQAVRASTGLRRPVTYPDKVSVAVTAVRDVHTKPKGPGEVGGVLTLFTLRFANGSKQALDLNKVRVVARYGPKHAQASPASYANLNDFYGTVAPGADKSATYAFDLPASGYKAVTIKVAFDARRKIAVFTGAIRA